MLEEVLEKTKCILGKEYPDTISAMKDPALTFRLQGEPEKAERLQRKALEKSQCTLGISYPDAISLRAELISTPLVQGKENDTEALLKCRV